MSEVYLTKIERKTIFTRALIFVLFMFVICDLTVTGPFYFNFIPWIYLIGMFGEIRKIDKALMTVISSFTVFISSIIVYGNVNLMCGINTGVCIILLLFGIIAGSVIREFILEHRLVKYIKPSKKVAYILILILLTVVSYGIVAVKDGNIFEYISSRNSLKGYLETTYGIKEFKIKEVRYNRNIISKYVYKVEIEGQVVEFVPVTKNRFKDSSMEERLQNLNIELQEEFNDVITKINMDNYKYIEDIMTKIEFEYSKPSILPDRKVIYISLNGVDYDKKHEQEIYSELADYINKITNMESVDKIVLELNDNSMEISKDKLDNVTGEFLQGGFVIEELDGSWG